MKKKVFFISLPLTLFLIFAPVFIYGWADESKYNNTNKLVIDDKQSEKDSTTSKDNNTSSDNKNKSNNENSGIQNSSKVEAKTEIKSEDDITTFSSKTCFKKTYYISADKVNAYENPDGKDKIAFSLKRDDIVLAYEESNGYVYCESDVGKKGWIRKNTNNLKGSLDKKTDYVVDISLSGQAIKVSKSNKLIKQMICATGTLKDSDTETPLGIFYVQKKDIAFFSQKYNEGGKYYIKFFGNYLIHSIPVDKNGNIIESEKNKLGIPVSHGCVRISMDNAKWMYDNLPIGSKISIHY